MTPRARTAWAVAASALSVAAAAVCVRAVAAQALQGVDSDTLLVADLAATLRERGGDFAWCSGGASYLFPDVAVFLALGAVVRDLATLHVAAFALHLASIAAATLLVLRASGLRGWTAASPLALGAAAAYAAILTRSPALAHGAFFPGVHRGVVAPGLAFVALAAWRERGTARRGIDVLCAALVAVAVLSDPGFCAWFVVPVHLGAAVAGGFRGPDLRRRAVWAAADGAACAAGFVLRLLADRTPHWATVPGNLATPFGGAGLAVGRYLRELPGTLEASPAGAVLVFLTAVAFAWRRGAGRTAVVRSLTAAAVVTAAAPAVLGLWADAGSARYLLPMYAVAFPGLAACAAAVDRPRARAAAAGAFVAVAVALAVPAAGGPPPVLPRIPLVEEIDRRNSGGAAAFGLADYWDARLVTALSRTGVVVRAMDPDGSPRVWACDPSGFCGRTPDGLRGPEVRFLVVREAHRSALEARFGRPASVEVVPGGRPGTTARAEIWRYPPPGPPARTDALLAALRDRCEILGLHVPEPARRR